MTENKKQWMAIYTKPRNEKKVADRLGKSGFEVYCPMYTTLRQWSDRKKKVTIPAIPSYCFIKIEENKRWEALQDPGAVRYVFWQGKPAIIKDNHIHAFKRFMGEIEEEDQIFNAEISDGDRVLMRKGAFMGKEGDVIRTHKNGIVELILFQIGLKVVVQKKNLDKI
ncbi:UpxY family transcription antiterminator [Flammeovirga yaeyamensis]|uniref:UpxY family transcription antiterminator n=1 Tax=Flammeovirga yaeyamensis TaxID=367791 RepID=A0AAX1MZN6_9BACT|nr:UpxY family transcription antiterminator [Flammeovirga yaeyamensis]MBB3700957.1 transcription antitermination factor NusG [Flammeovirga yaeyamensis]NMF38064.1 UpxY family transcription antiterminator [Flammeovirga yaeyamensis]QWG00714.1 UpxY family transcription antiterminator [Flammeovirga yaeyamensis]